MGARISKFQASSLELCPHCAVRTPALQPKKKKQLHTVMTIRSDGKPGKSNQQNQVKAKEKIEIK